MERKIFKPVFQKNSLSAGILKVGHNKQVLITMCVFLKKNAEYSRHKICFFGILSEMSCIQ